RATRTVRMVLGTLRCGMWVSFGIRLCREGRGRGAADSDARGRIVMRLSSGGREPGQLEPEPRSAPEGARDGDGAAVGVDDRAHDREAEAGPGVTRSRADEPVEDPPE